MADDQAPCVRITIEVPIHASYPAYYRDEQHDLIRAAVAEAIVALKAAGEEAAGEVSRG